MDSKGARRVRDAIVATFVVGLLVRLVAIALTDPPSDFLIYGSVIDAARFGAPLYRDSIFSYPPLFGYYLEIVGRLLQALSIPTFARPSELLQYVISGLSATDLTVPAVTILVKLPELAIDAFIAWQIYDLRREFGWSDLTAAGLAALCWINPVLIYNGAVNGAWDDAIPAVALAVLRAARGGAWFRAGTWIALGVLAKLVPIYFTLPLLAWVLRPGRSPRERLSGAALVLAGLAATLAIGLLPVLVWGEVPELRRALFTRFGDFSPEGLTLLSALQLDPFAAVRTWVVAQRSLLIGAYSLAGLAAPLAIAAAVFVRARTLRSLALALTCVAVSPLVFSPFVQANYVIWIAPLFVLLYRRGDRSWPYVSLALGTVAAIFIHVVRGTDGVIFPGCYFYRVCDAQSAAAAAYRYHYQPGHLAWSHQTELNALIGILGGAMLIGAAIVTAREFIRDARFGDVSPTPS